MELTKEDLARMAQAYKDVPQIGVELVRQDALGHIVVDGARKLRHELFEPGAARAGLLAHVVVAVVDTFEVADARVVARVAAIVEAVGRAQQLLMLKTLLIARDLAVRRPTATASRCRPCRATSIR